MKHILKLLVFTTLLCSSINPQGTIIFLNGTSSAGKTALTAALQRLGNYEKVNVDENYSEPFMQAAINYIKEKTGVEATTDNLNEVAEQLTKEGKLTKKDDAEIYALEKQIYMKMLQTVKDYATIRKLVIFDMLVENERNLRNCYEPLRELNVAFILAYCPFTELAQRVRKRTSEKDPRTFTQVFVQFSHLYKAAQPGDTPILGTLTSEEVKQNCELAKQDEPWIFEEMELSSFDELTPTVLKNLSLDENKTIQVTPRLKYDFVVDTGINSPEKCANQIKQFMESKAPFTAFQENYEQLPRIKWWQRFKNWFKEKRENRNIAWGNRFKKKLLLRV